MKKKKVNLLPSPLQLGSVFIGSELLPIKQVQKCMERLLKKSGLQYMYDAQGFRPLRQSIASRLQKDGISADPDWILMTTGSQNALDICSRSFHWKSVAMENPGYGGAKHLFELNGLKTIGLHLDPFVGPNFKQWRKALLSSKANAIYLTPHFHNPTGYSYKDDEIQKLLQLCEEFSLEIIEDDWASDMRKSVSTKRSLRAQVGSSILYINSFTKKLLPSLRLGYVLANEEKMSSILRVKQLTTLGNPALIERVLFEFLESGDYDKHLRHLQKQMQLRYHHCQEMLQELMPLDVRWTQPSGGPILWLELPPSVSLSRLHEQLEKRNVFLDRRTPEWFFGRPHIHGIKIGYGYYPEEVMQKGLEILAEEIERQL